MFLNLDKQNKKKLAVVDNAGHRLNYEELVNDALIIGSYVEPRSIVFCLCKNEAGSLAGYIGFVEKTAVPVTLSYKTDGELLSKLIDTYSPQYMWLPCEFIDKFEYDPIFEILGYALLKFDNEKYPINDKLQLLMTTSGSTGSPKFVRYKKGNLESNARNVAIAFGWTAEERAICDLGMQYTMGLNVINTHLYVGATVLLTTYNLMSS